MIGVNDFNYGYSVDEVFYNYKIIVHNLNICGMKVFVQSTIFAGKKKKYLNTKIIY